MGCLCLQITGQRNEVQLKAKGNLLLTRSWWPAVRVFSRSACWVCDSLILWAFLSRSQYHHHSSVVVLCTTGLQEEGKGFLSLSFSLSFCHVSLFFSLCPSSHSPFSLSVSFLLFLPPPLSSGTKIPLRFFQRICLRSVGPEPRRMLTSSRSLGSYHLGLDLPWLLPPDSRRAPFSEPAAACMLSRLNNLRRN